MMCDIGCSPCLFVCCLFVSSRRRHTRCALVTGVQTCALPICEELLTVAAGDTVRWIVGDTSSGAGGELRVNVLVKPIRTGLKTNLVITTSRRTYLTIGRASCRERVCQYV